MRRCAIYGMGVLCSLALASRFGVCADDTVELRYKRAVGQVNRYKIVVEGGGYAKDPLRTQQSRLRAEITVREEVTRRGPGGAFTLKSRWESAKFIVDGEEADLDAGTVTTERRVNDRGEVLWVRKRGRVKPSRRGPEVDPAQLNIMNLLMDQALYAQLPEDPVKAGDDWKVVERADYQFSTVEMTKLSTVESVGTGDEAGTCVIATEITAPLDLNLDVEGVRFEGKVDGSLRHSFDYDAGRLRSAHGRMEIDVTGSPVGLPETQPVETAFDTDFAVKMEFTVDAECERVAEGKAGKRK